MLIANRDVVRNLRISDGRSTKLGIRRCPNHVAARHGLFSGVPRRSPAWLRISTTTTPDAAALSVPKLPPAVRRRSALGCVAKAEPPAPPPPVLSYLNYFQGTWSVHGLGYPATLTGAWRDKSFIVIHPAIGEQPPPRFADTFSDENSAFVRHDQTPHPGIFFVSGGWQGDRWEWTRGDCSERITYDRIDTNTMLVTEEARDPQGCDVGFCGGPYRLVRRYEARRQ